MADEENELPDFHPQTVLQDRGNGQPAPNYVTCPCQHCSGKIEFDANQLDSAKNANVICPHCELQTIIFAPERKMPGVKSDEDFSLSAKVEAAQEEKVRLRKIYHLARGHFFGEGLEQDLVEAYKWIYIVEGPGGCGFGEAISEDEDSELDNIRNVLAEKLTPAQIREAHSRAALECQELDDSVSQSRQAIPSEVRREVWRRDCGLCAKCGSRRNLEYDHIVPVSKGGSNTARNIELLCETCNRSKSALIQ